MDLFKTGDPCFLLESTQGWIKGTIASMNDENFAIEHTDGNISNISTDKISRRVRPRADGDITYLEQINEASVIESVIESFEQGQRMVKVPFSNEKAVYIHNFSNDLDMQFDNFCKNNGLDGNSGENKNVMIVNDDGDTLNVVVREILGNFYENQFDGIIDDKVLNVLALLDQFGCVKKKGKKIRHMGVSLSLTRMDSHLSGSIAACLCSPFIAVDDTPLCLDEDHYSTTKSILTALEVETEDIERILNHLDGIKLCQSIRVRATPKGQVVQPEGILGALSEQWGVDENDLKNMILREASGTIQDIESLMNLQINSLIASAYAGIFTEISTVASLVLETMETSQNELPEMPSIVIHQMPTTTSPRLNTTPPPANLAQFLGECFSDVAWSVMDDTKNLAHLNELFSSPLSWEGFQNIMASHITHGKSPVAVFEHQYGKVSYDSEDFGKLFFSPISIGSFDAGYSSLHEYITHSYSLFRESLEATVDDMSILFALNSNEVGLKGSLDIGSFTKKMNHFGITKFMVNGARASLKGLPPSPHVTPIASRHLSKSSKEATAFFPSTTQRPTEIDISPRVEAEQPTESDLFVPTPTFSGRPNPITDSIPFTLNEEIDENEIPNDENTETNDTSPNYTLSLNMHQEVSKMFEMARDVRSKALSEGLDDNDDELINGYKDCEEKLAALDLGISNGTLDEEDFLEESELVQQQIVTLSTTVTKALDKKHKVEQDRMNIEKLLERAQCVREKYMAKVTATGIQKHPGLKELISLADSAIESVKNLLALRQTTILLSTAENTLRLVEETSITANQMVDKAEEDHHTLAVAKEHFDSHLDRFEILQKRMEEHQLTEIFGVTDSILKCKKSLQRAQAAIDGSKADTVHDLLIASEKALTDADEIIQERVLRKQDAYTVKATDSTVLEEAKAKLQKTKEKVAALQLESVHSVKSSLELVNLALKTVEETTFDPSDSEGFSTAVQLFIERVDQADNAVTYASTQQEKQHLQITSFEDMEKRACGAAIQENRERLASEQSLRQEALATLQLSVTELAQLAAEAETAGYTSDETSKLAKAIQLADEIMENSAQVIMTAPVTTVPESIDRGVTAVNNVNNLLQKEIEKTKNSRIEEESRNREQVRLAKLREALEESINSPEAVWAMEATSVKQALTSAEAALNVSEEQIQIGTLMNIQTSCDAAESSVVAAVSLIAHAADKQAVKQESVEVSRQRQRQLLEATDEGDMLSDRLNTCEGSYEVYSKQGRLWNPSIVSQAVKDALKTREEYRVIIRSSASDLEEILEILDRFAGDVSRAEEILEQEHNRYENYHRRKADKMKRLKKCQEQHGARFIQMIKTRITTPRSSKLQNAMKSLSIDSKPAYTPSLPQTPTPPSPSKIPIFKSGRTTIPANLTRPIVPAMSPASIYETPRNNPFEGSSDSSSPRVSLREKMMMLKEARSTMNSGRNTPSLPKSGMPPQTPSNFRIQESDSEPEPIESRSPTRTNDSLSSKSRLSSHHHHNHRRFFNEEDDEEDNNDNDESLNFKVKKQAVSPPMTTKHNTKTNTTDSFSSPSRFENQNGDKLNTLRTPMTGSRQRVAHTPGYLKPTFSTLRRKQQVSAGLRMMQEREEDSN
eukprot:TRINITY_DN5091_c0_g3_i1.p1 TRINITY_DN5091_c0_g3~~TRINITY_DN5091_c0_g3_i1.p1  ORF type:complete len:1615 (+),score=591.76 TRINITY_DN5091_c0_g3_i1:110-4954(+)